MTKQQIVIEIDLDGATTVEAQGMTGQGCRAFTAAIEAALGATVSDRPKPEMTATATKQQASQGGGR